MGKFPRELDENARATPHERSFPSSFLTSFPPLSLMKLSLIESRGRDHSQTEAQFRREPALILWHAKILERSEE